MSGLVRWVVAGAAVLLGTAASFPAVGAAGTPGWRIGYDDPGGSLVPITATGPGNAWAAGSRVATGLVPQVVHWDGRSWRSARLPGGLNGTIRAIGASSATNVWAFSVDMGWLIHWDGSRWSVSRGVMPGDVTATVVFSPSDVWAFGCPGESDGVGAVHFDGHGWHRYPLTYGEICSASALSPSDIWASGFGNPGDGGFITHWDGTAWQRVPSPLITLPDGKLHIFGANSFAVLSASDVWAFGGASIGSGQAQRLFPAVMRWDGRAWHRIGVPGSGFELGRATPDGHGGFWAVTSLAIPPQAHLLHYSHGQWTRVTLPTLNGETLMPVDLTQVPGTASAWATAGHPSTPGSVILRDQP
ncbi:MAG TPA: hypothetical protein VGS19_34895 [Streptosporangiaceae bacterium]|nr:hypothetical protein [Streptosporangiaceae bacterium]